MRIVNTFAPGGAADFLARTVADNLSTAFGQQFFVETRSGAAGAIGVNSVVATPPDGYNFVITNITMLVLSPITNPKLGYHPERDLTNIAYLGGSPVVLSVNSEEQDQDARRLHRLRQEERQAADLFVVRRRHQRPPVRRDVRATRSASRSSTCPTRARRRACSTWSAATSRCRRRRVTSTAGQIRGGTLRGIAVTAKERMADFPDVPTFNELGHPEFSSPIWFSLSAPKGLPADIVEKMNGEITRS